MLSQEEFESVAYCPLLELDLQFFGDDKTEEPTAKKISDTRKKGQVGKSQELGFAIELFVLFLTLRFVAFQMGERFISIFKWIFTSVVPDYISSEKGTPTVVSMHALFKDVYLQMLLLVLPFMLAGFFSALFGTGLQFQFKVSTEPLKPNLNKFNPINGLKRIFSKQALFNLFLSIAKITMIFLVAYSVISTHIHEIFILYELDLFQAIALVGQLVVDTGLRISFIYLLIGFVDLIYQKRKFKKDIKMTKQEVKDEFKNSEGDPQIKGQQRQKMREVSQRRMMQQVPQADVVITNPTHIAVAVKYDTEVANAPVVVAKGEDFLAQKIREAATEHGVEIVENKPLARAIYTTVEVGQQIPPELYQAVAEVLAVIYNKKKPRH
ncbi:MAG: flagellar biosynthesis protein FlhB [Lachnospiraceae bacterium]|nr:flagellar biosynthesis protein FlhB [Lachnospiraceae bacterium]